MLGSATQADVIDLRERGSGDLVKPVDRSSVIVETDMAFRQLPVLVSGQIVECLGDLLGGNISVEIHGCRCFALSVLSCDDDHAIGSTSTINGCRRAVLEHINLLDIIRGNLGK